MPNDSRSRRDKKEKEKKRKDKKDPKPLRKELPAEEAEATSSDIDGMEALAISVSLLGAKAGSEEMETSLSAFSSLSSTAEAKDSSEEKKHSSLSQEDSEDGGNLSDDSEEVTPISRLLSPSQSIRWKLDEAIRKQGEAVRSSGNRVAGKFGLYLSSSFPPPTLSQT
jgi:hypothetical protein